MATECNVCSDTPGWKWVTVTNPYGQKEQRLSKCVCRGGGTASKAQAEINQIGSRYQNARLTHFDRRVAEVANTFVKGPKDGLFISGPPGTGKTHFAAALVRALIESGKCVMFRRAADLYSEIRASFDDAGQQTEQGVLAKYADATVLVLDDLAAGSLSDHERRSTLEILDRRWSFERATIVTSNLSLSEISARMDARIGSRLGSYTQMVLAGRDRRRTNAD